MERVGENYQKNMTGSCFSGKIYSVCLFPTNVNYVNNIQNKSELLNGVVLVMGVVISKREFDMLDRGSLLKPLVYCFKDDDLEARAVSLNVSVAEKLLLVNVKRRAMRMEQCIRQVIDKLPDNTLIKDIDVLFNPTYEVDVLKLLTSLYRVKPFDILWPGRCKDGKLIYAEEGFSDYKVFVIKNYDMTCVVQEDVAYEIF